MFLSWQETLFKFPVSPGRPPSLRDTFLYLLSFDSNALPRAYDVICLEHQMQTNGISFKLMDWKDNRYLFGFGLEQYFELTQTMGFCLWRILR